MKSLSRDSSLKTFVKDYQSIHCPKKHQNKENLFTLKIVKNDKQLQKTFHCFNTAKGEKMKRSQNSLTRVNSEVKFDSQNSLPRNPLKDILSRNKNVLVSDIKNSQQEKGLNSNLMSQIIDKRQKNENQNRFKTYQKSCEKILVNPTNISEYPSTIHFDRIKPIENFQYIKNFQTQINKSVSRSRSSKRKGLQCTLFEKSLEKKANQSLLKSNKKLITIKKRVEKTEAFQQVQNQVTKKDTKKVLLKRKNKDNQTTNQSLSFNSIVFNEKLFTKNDQNLTKKIIKSGSLSKVSQNIRSVSKNKKTPFNRLNQSMSLIKQTCRNHKFQSLKKKSVQKRKRQESRQRSTRSKSKYEILSRSQSQGIKSINNNKISQNLLKVHEKYKFILNYLSDNDIVGKLSGYMLAGKQECKWILLLIDEVYEMIKHSAETKLKGIDYTRDYQYLSTKHD